MIYGTYSLHHIDREVCVENDCSSQTPFLSLKQVKYRSYEDEMYETR